MTQPVNPSRSAQRSLSPQRGGAWCRQPADGHVIGHDLWRASGLSCHGARGEHRRGWPDRGHCGGNDLPREDFLGRGQRLDRAPQAACGSGLRAVGGEQTAVSICRVGIGRAGGTYRRPARQGHAGCSTRCAAGRCDPRRNSRHGVRPAAGALHRSAPSWVRSRRSRS
jgi:hypothetical protein